MASQKCVDSLKEKRGKKLFMRPSNRIQVSKQLLCILQLKIQFYFIIDIKNIWYVNMHTL